MARRPGGDAAGVTSRNAPRLVEIDGIRLRVSVVGDIHAGEPLVLCNGIGGALELWEPLRAALGRHPSIAFDAPGVAESSVPAYPPTMAGLARTVVHLLDHLGVGQADALGVSWGGALAQELAHRHPDRIRRLVLCATGAGGLLIPGHPRVMAILATPLRYWSPTYLTRVAPVLYGPDICDDPEMLARQRHIRFTRSPSGRGYLYQVLALRRFVSALWLHRLRQPTLVLHGDADPIVPVTNGRILAARIPNARLETVPGGGHLFLLTRPQEMARLITDFLD
ncbi:MAG: alpha/beta fold hydrolase [Acidimicrobiia bacterium]